MISTELYTNQLFLQLPLPANYFFVEQTDIGVLSGSFLVFLLVWFYFNPLNSQRERMRNASLYSGFTTLVRA